MSHFNRFISNLASYLGFLGETSGLVVTEATLFPSQIDFGGVEAGCSSSSQVNINVSN